MTRVILFGSQQIALGFVEHLSSEPSVDLAMVVSSESRRDELLGCDSLVSLARQLGIVVRAPRRAADLHGEIAGLQPDVILSLYYRKILPPSVLALPRLGCVNIHPSLLPEYRGPTPTAWAILNGETRFGITIHLMDKGVDTGDILVREEYDIQPDETGYELHTRAMSLGLGLLKTRLRDIVEQRMTPIPQKGTGSYYGRLPAEAIINWQLEAARIQNMVRVYAEPYDRARTELEGKLALVNRVIRVVENETYLLQGPGRIVGFEGERPIVSCADGFLVLDDFEFVPPLTESERAALLRPGNAFRLSGSTLRDR